MLGKPIFFRILQNFLDQLQLSGDVLLIDDSLYKFRFNPIGSCIIVPKIEKQYGDYLAMELSTWLIAWRDAADRAMFARTWTAPAPTSANSYVEHGFKKDCKKWHLPLLQKLWCLCPLWSLEATVDAAVVASL